MRGRDIIRLTEGEIMNHVNNTLYIPLYAKAYVSKKGLFLSDKTAEKIWNQAAFPLGRKSRSGWLAYFLGIRAAVFDEWVKKQLTDTDGAVVIHIGCGLDSRFVRVGMVNTPWVDVDFSEVIEERKRYFAESDNYRMLAADVRKAGWVDALPQATRAVVIMEGVSMYMPPSALRRVFAALDGRFENIALLADAYTTLGAKLSKYKNPVNEVGVTAVYGMDEPTQLAIGGIDFYKEHCLTPQRYIEELRGAKRRIFKSLYAGGVAKKMYRLWEYRK